MSNSVVKEARDLIQVRSGKAAEDYLLSIADSKGDQALAPILEQLNPLEWASIMRDHTAGVPSALVDLLTPDQIAQAIQAEPLFWHDSLKKQGDMAFATIAVEVEEFLRSIFTNDMDAHRRSEILDAIANSDAGIFFLAIPFWNIADQDDDFEEEGLADDGAERTMTINMGLDTDNELFELIRYTNSAVADRIIGVLQDPGHGFEDEDWVALVKSVYEVIQQAEASISDEDKEVVISEEIGEDMFLPV